MQTATQQRVERVLNLRVGEWVQVRSAEEILATLDENQAFEGMPFMPEMLEYCGKKFRVHKSAHKTCDTVRDYAIRTLPSTGHLEQLRCDGAGHVGCQAGCLLFFKEAWLQRTTPPTAAETAAAARQPKPSPQGTVHWATLMRGTHAAPTPEGRARYRCQATDLHVYTTEVTRRGRWDPRLYIKDLTSGNVSLLEFVRYGAIAVFSAFTVQFFGRRYPHLCGQAVGRTPDPGGNLKAGDTVQVRSKEEILKTVGPNLRNRGLSFDVEMLRFCENGEYTVQRQVEQIVDEKTGLLIKLPNPALILEGVTCSGMRSSDRMFCPREIYPYWRASWLKPCEGHNEQEAAAATKDVAKPAARELAPTGAN